MIEWIKEQFASNEFFAGFIGAGIIGWISWFGRNVPRHIYSWLQSKFGLVYQVNSSTRDKLYKFLEWAKREKLFNRQKYQVFERVGVSHVFSSKESDESKRNSCIGPAPASYWGFYEGRPYRFGLTVTKNENGGWEYEATFLIWGVSKVWIGSFLDQMERIYKVEECLKLYNLNGDHWESRPLPERTMDSIFVQDDTKNEMLADIARFRKNHSVYKRSGVAYKRSYLLYGQPGTGKSSLAFALANYLGKNIYLFNLSSLLCDRDLIRAWSSISEGSIILFEDIDAQNFKTKRKGGKNDNSIDLSTLSFSCLLNCLDGSFQERDQIVILTTNYKDDLDVALVRPGRVDREFFIDLISRDEALGMVEFITGERNENLLTKSEKDGKYLPCLIQENCFRHINEAE